MALVKEAIAQAVRKAAVYNPDIQAAPACVLWPDKDRQWERVIPLIQERLTELFVLGEYNPALRQGPAIWLRCVIAGALKNTSVPDGIIPIIYMPGISRQDLQAVEACPDALKPLAE